MKALKLSQQNMTSGYYGSNQVMPDLPFIQFQLKTPKCSTQDKIWQQHNWLMKQEAYIQMPILCLLVGCLRRDPRHTSLNWAHHSLPTRNWSPKSPPKQHVPSWMYQEPWLSMCFPHPCSGDWWMFSISVNGTISSCWITSSWHLLFPHTSYSLCRLSPDLMILPLKYLSSLTSFCLQRHYLRPGSLCNSICSCLIVTLYVFLFHPSTYFHWLPGLYYMFLSVFMTQEPQKQTRGNPLYDGTYLLARETTKQHMIT